MTHESSPPNPPDLGRICALQNIDTYRSEHHIDASLEDRLCLYRIDPENPLAICGAIVAYAQEGDPPQYKSHITQRGEKQCSIIPDETALNLHDERGGPLDFLNEVVEHTQATPLTDTELELPPEDW